MGIHTDHRQRLKAAFRANGLDSFQPHNALELLLFYAIPQKDVNPLAHALIDRFGSFQGVLDAPYEELLKVPGMGEHSATLIKLMPDISRYYLRHREDVIVNSSATAWQVLEPKFIGLRDEVCYLLCLDAKGKVLKCPEISRGSVNQTEVSHRRILQEALSSNAAGVIMAHNHPGGVALASTEDLQTTQRVRKLLDSIGVALLDHLIAGDGDYISLADSGCFL